MTFRVVTFAGTVRSKQSVNLAWFDAQSQIADRDDGAALERDRECFRQPGDRDGRLSHAGS